MKLRLNRELKAYCADFVTARNLLRDCGAVFVEDKEQVDHYYHLPAANDAVGTRRLKLRVESRLFAPCLGDYISGSNEDLINMPRV